ncbi:fumarylacetoacetase [Natronoglycomyces albus]|uniref:fumarylacetoacetase n=1 Tax=Natronoglycomyces albus TaxID=2811108 RepID=A0A895XR83_9ACTN|nr:fumarylacetoacetase [Natronoglycomyces albus]QSB05675.1 fumarylacetoacetase [Natronoglycomyces albus]
MSWVPGADESPYNIHNLPYGVFSTAEDPTPRIGVRIGDFVFDMKLAVRAGNCQDCPTCTALQDQVLNRFMSLGRQMWTKVRTQVHDALTEPSMREVASSWLVPIEEAQMHLPFLVTDFTDFHSSEHHTANLGHIFRPGAEALPANWKYQPLGYQGRAATVMPNGTAITRPHGQRIVEDRVDFGPSFSLDIEAEVGFVVGSANPLGTGISPDEFKEHVFGVVLLNDWSARDLQAWENTPLGPFTGKSFATTMSSWVTPLDALAPAMTTAPPQGPETPAYLKEADRYAYDVRLSVQWNGTEVARPNLRQMYWTPAQQLAHLTSNGAMVRPGDLFGSGTVSGPTKGERGCFMELTWGGQEPVMLADGTPRTYLRDGDTVRIEATAPGPKGTSIALGEVEGTIGPARHG